MWVCVKQQIASNLEFLQNRDLQVVFEPENGSKCPRNAPEKSTGERKSIHILPGGHKHVNWSVLGLICARFRTVRAEQSITC